MKHFWELRGTWVPNIETSPNQFGQTLNSKQNIIFPGSDSPILNHPVFPAALVGRDAVGPLEPLGALEPGNIWGASGNQPNVEIWVFRLNGCNLELDTLPETNITHGKSTILMVFASKDGDFHGLC